MTRRSLLALTLAFLLGPFAHAAAAADQYSISVDDMHCSNCARKIAGRLLAVKGVRSVRTSVSTHTATITPQTSQQPSAKALWEAVEKAGFKPVKLITPSGEFKEKPQA